MSTQETLLEHGSSSQQGKADVFGGVEVAQAEIARASI